MKSLGVCSWREVFENWDRLDARATKALEAWLDKQIQEQTKEETSE